MTSETQILDWLVPAIATVTELDPATIDPDQSVHTLGIDSAAVISLTFDVEDRFNVELNPTSLFEPPSLRAFARDLAARLNTPPTHAS